MSDERHSCRFWSPRTGCSIICGQWWA